MDIKEYVARETGCGFYLADAREISTFKGGGKAWIFQPESTEKLVMRQNVILFNLAYCYAAHKSSSFLNFHISTVKDRRITVKYNIILVVAFERVIKKFKQNRVGFLGLIFSYAKF